MILCRYVGSFAIFDYNQKKGAEPDFLTLLQLKQPNYLMLLLTKNNIS